MGSRENTDWLPGLGNPPYSSQNSISVPPDPEADEVEYSVVCDGCGKHFWSLSKAHSHAALTAHVLHEETMSPSSHVGVLHSPVNNSARASETNTVFTSTAEAEANTDTSDRGDGEDSEGDRYPLCSDCGKYFWSHEEANFHARIGHIQDTAIVPLSAPGGWPELISTSSAANSSIHPSYPDWNIGPGTASLAGNESTTPNSPYWTTGPVIGHAISPAYPLYDGCVISTSPGYNGGVNPASTYLNIGYAMTLFGKQFARPVVPNSESQASRSESDRNLRRSSGVSPSPSTYGSPSTQDVPRSVNTAIQTVSTPRQTAPPSPSSSCGTLDHPQVTFPLELFDRIFFIVTPSGNRKGPSFIMGLPEAQNVMTFRTGVRARLESQGEKVGLREIVARPSWLSVPVYADTNEDHHLLLLVIKNWPEWQKANGNTSCHVFVTLEDEKESEEQGEKQQEIPGAAED